MLARSLLQSGGQSFGVQVIVETNGRQVCLRAVVRLQHKDIGARICKGKITVPLRLAEPQPRTQVNDSAVRSNCFESLDSSRRNRRALAKRAVTHLQRHRSK